MKKTLLALCICAGTIAPAGQVAAHHKTPPVDMSRKKYGAIMPDAYYENLAWCETRKKIGEYHNTRNYTSSFGIAKGTAWRWSGKRNLNKLTPRQLIRVADRIAFSGWDRPDGEHVWRVGPWGWSVVKQNCNNLQAYICWSNHPKVQKWKRGC